MKKAPVLVVMAAGMGSRFGGLKQIAPVGSQGEAILDYSLYDAARAGFRKAVIIIKEEIRGDFMSTVGRRLEKCPLQIEYVFQELDKLPEGYTVPEGRTKPWGTCHAVLCAAEAIGEAPFAVVNADDYYGRDGYRQIFGYLCRAPEGDYCMVGYRLGNTVTEHGSVARGVCQVDEAGFLTAIRERTRIEVRDGGIAYTEDGTHWVDLPADTIVSMNLWGFQPGFLAHAKEKFRIFLDTAAKETPLKAEFFLPFVVADLLEEGKARARVLSSHDKWYGVTYAADKPQVVAALAALTAQGQYPDGLWD